MKETGFITKPLQIFRSISIRKLLLKGAYIIHIIALMLSNNISIYERVQLRNFQIIARSILAFLCFKHLAAWLQRV